MQIITKVYIVYCKNKKGLALFEGKYFEWNWPWTINVKINKIMTECTKRPALSLSEDCGW